MQSAFGSWAKLARLKANVIEENMFLVLDFSTLTLITHIWTTQPCSGLLQAVGTKPELTMVTMVTMGGDLQP
eukprot:1159161-Pelagomonas_calceolata.AAC.1